MTKQPQASARDNYDYQYEKFKCSETQNRPDKETFPTCELAKPEMETLEALHMQWSNTHN